MNVVGLTNQQEVYIASTTRNAYILENSGAKVLLTQSAHLGTLANIASDSWNLSEPCFLWMCQ